MQMELMRRTLSIPYSDRLAQIDHSRVMDTDGHRSITRGDPYGAYMIAIGLLARQDMPDSEKTLDTLILGCEDATSKPHVVQHQLSPADHASRSDHMTMSTRRQESNDENIALYTMALKEFGDSSGNEPSYSCVQHTLDPPLFEVTVSVKGRQFGGRAKTKKQAKHLASQKACQRFGISI